MGSPRRGHRVKICCTSTRGAPVSTQVHTTSPRTRSDDNQKSSEWEEAQPWLLCESMGRSLDRAQRPQNSPQAVIYGFTLQKDTHRVRLEVQRAVDDSQWIDWKMPSQFRCEANWVGFFWVWVCGPTLEVRLCSTCKMFSSFFSFFTKYFYFFSLDVKMFFIFVVSVLVSARTQRDSKK